MSECVYACESGFCGPRCSAWFISGEALGKRNEIDLFLQWMVTGNEKWVTYYNTVRKRSWSKCSEAAQTEPNQNYRPGGSTVYLV
ncbi:hypothetical protein TNCV_422971 [Trichonephila clavipes]|nr:hypothetical protein TNCV_422971 [Trichonephila clavipes]